MHRAPAVTLMNCRQEKPHKKRVFKRHSAKSSQANALWEIFITDLFKNEIELKKSHNPFFLRVACLGEGTHQWSHQAGRRLAGENFSSVTQHTNDLSRPFSLSVIRKGAHRSHWLLPYLIFDLFSPLTQFLAQFCPTQQNVYRDKKFSPKQRKLPKN